MISPTLITLEMVSAYDDMDSLFKAVLAEEHYPDLTTDRRFQGMHPLR